jgi:hypothetical protein
LVTAPPAAPLPSPAVPGASQQERWRAAIEAVKVALPRHAKSLAFGRLVAMRPGEAVLAFPKEAGFHRVTVTGSTRAAIEQALSQHFGRPTRIVDESSESACAAASPSVAELDLQDRAAREKGIESKVRAHPAVRAALRILGGELEHVQVLDRDRADGSEGEPPDEGA